MSPTWSLRIWLRDQRSSENVLLAHLNCRRQVGDLLQQILLHHLSADLVLVFTGLVKVTVPSELVHYHDKASINCSTKEDLGAQPLWKLKKDNGIFLITNGTVSTVATQKNQSTVELNRVDELWEGIFYNQDHLHK